MLFPGVTGISGNEKIICGQDEKGNILMEKKRKMFMFTYRNAVPLHKEVIM